LSSCTLDTVLRVHRALVVSRESPEQSVLLGFLALSVPQARWALLVSLDLVAQAVRPVQLDSQAQQAHRVQQDAVAQQVPRVRGAALVPQGAPDAVHLAEGPAGQGARVRPVIVDPVGLLALPVSQAAVVLAVDESPRPIHLVRPAPCSFRCVEALYAMISHCEAFHP